MVKLSEEARKRKGRYDAKRTAEVSTHLAFRLQNATDMDVIEKVRSVPNKAAYLRRLVREDMAREKAQAV